MIIRALFEANNRSLGLFVVAADQWGNPPISNFLTNSTR